MTTTIKEYVSTCEACIRSKHERRPTYGLLMSLPIATKPWEALSLDFIIDLPPSNSYNTTMVTVDMLTKMAHFVPLKKLPSLKETVQTSLDHVIKLPPSF